MTSTAQRLTTLSHTLTLSLVASIVQFLFQYRLVLMDNVTTHLMHSHRCVLLLPVSMSLYLLQMCLEMDQQ